MQDIGLLVTIDGFVKIINKVARDEIAYPNFKIREKQSAYKRERNSYIFVDDNELHIDIDGIKINNKRNTNIIFHESTTRTKG